MKRREFLASSTMALSLILTNCRPGRLRYRFPIHVQSDHQRGHSLFSGDIKWKNGKERAVDTLIVGGGIAGLSAAYSLKAKDYLLLELSSDWGGTSGKNDFEGIPLCTGAHYDLAYPEYYGEEVLSMLQELDIIKYHSWNHSWGFMDRQFIIPNKRKNQCYDHGKKRSDVLPDGIFKREFEADIFNYSGKMPLPSRLITEDLHHLNSLSFEKYLIDRFRPDAHFLRCMDYHMRDDYGAPSANVSALAGIHYFICRPYYTEVVELFSPPQGNYYFIEKLRSSLNEERMQRNCMVSRIENTALGKVATILDFKNNEICKITAGNIIYAGNKHALKHIYPEDYHLFSDTEYAPWLVVNVIIENKLEDIGFWQNEMIVEDSSFLGFVDSSLQYPDRKDFRVLTCYYCLTPESREDLVNMEANKETIAEKTINYIEDYFGRSVSSMVRGVNIKAMGHAMPIPAPGYLFKDANTPEKSQLIYAGVDNGNLPLFFEAADSGLMAASIIT